MSDMAAVILGTGFLIGGVLGALFTGLLVATVILAIVTAPFKFIADRITWGKKR